YKDKAGRQEKNINVGLLDYPVLQAADILIYGKNNQVSVPVGEDQVQHVELTRSIARMFNNRFGKIFKEPEVSLTKTPRLMSLLEPEKKMSKSLGADHCIFMSDEPKVIEKKIKRAVTATGTGKKMSPGVKNLFVLLENFGTQNDIKKFEKEYKEGQIKYSEMKSVIANRIADEFKDFRNKKKKLKNNDVEKIFRTGAKKAQKIAQETMNEVRKKVGLK
ncbi:MAG: tryptophan--tRNA ligase, partial [Parcubacteria group bacterium]|nr:tryptophan--tRNA ligase [Parcubacteria group bacterium]